MKLKLISLLFNFTFFEIKSLFLFLLLLLLTLNKFSFFDIKFNNVDFPENS
jgi:hypothetical protein